MYNQIKFSYRPVRGAAQNCVLRGSRYCKANAKRELVTAPGPKTWSDVKTAFYRGGNVMSIIDIDDGFIRATITRRNPDSHKGTYGKVLIYAGSAGMAGAAVLCGSAALKSGSGLVRYQLPSFDSPLLTILQISVPEATCLEFDPDADFNEYDAIACGPGLGKGSAQKEILACILDNYERKLILDADALNMISEDEELADKVRNSAATVIMTPHIGEARRLLGRFDKLRTEDSRVTAAREIAEKYNSIAILKSARTLIAKPHSEDIYRNTGGNPGMATGGSGDVLTGVLVSLAGQGRSPMLSAITAVFIHSLAGDMAADDLGEFGMISSDIVDHLPYAIKKYDPKIVPAPAPVNVSGFTEDFTI